MNVLTIRPAIIGLQDKLPKIAALLVAINERAEKDNVDGSFGNIENLSATLAPSTQRTYRDALQWLRRVFDSINIDAITPQHIAQYRDRRSKKAAVRANREVSLFSTIFNHAREWGYTAKENPTKGVRKNKETPRDFYADDELWQWVYRHASPEMQDAMDMNYLTGQRPADVMKMKLSDIRDGALETRQNKTQKKLRILLKNPDGSRTELGRVIDRITNRPRQVYSFYLVATPDGRPLSRSMRRMRFDDARAAAAEAADKAGLPELAARIRAFQFRDIRPKAASETDLRHASELLGHTEQEITEKVYRRRGQTVMPTK